MELEFIKPRVQAGRRYHGEITKYTPNRTQTALYVFVTIDDEPELEFMKRFDADMSIHSQLADFCDNMRIFTGELTADLNELIGRRVILRLTRKNRKLYIDKLWLDEEYYDLDDEDKEDDENE